METCITSEGFQTSRAILERFFTAVYEEESVLTGGEKLGNGGRALKCLKETEVTFGNPKDNLIRLIPSLFETAGVHLNPVQKKQLTNKYDFYLLTLNISMKPAPSVQFKRLECELQFGPKGEHEPIIQSLFPKREWREVLVYGGELNLGISGDLDWNAGIDTSQFAGVMRENLPGNVKALVHNTNQVRSFIAIPNFRYSLGRADIAETGEGNSFAFWRIDSPELREVQTMKLGVVFKVLKGTKVLELTGKVFVEPDLPWLVAQVRDVFDDLSQDLKNIFKKGSSHSIRLGDFEKWIIELPE